MAGCVKDERQVYRVPAWSAFDWLDHGFGTRHSLDFNALQAATVKQIHSGFVLPAAEPAGCIGEGDALITDRQGVRLAIRTADCIPVLLVDPLRRAVAAIHAGWRGTLAAISSSAVHRMHTAFGSRPDDIHAAIGPGIGVCCFEVGAEVGGLFQAEVTEKVHLNLPELNRAQLLEVGVPARQIEVAGLCTRCQESEFHSFRRDRERAGRMVSSIMIS